MRKIFSASPLVLCVLGALALYGCTANGLSGLTGSLPEGQTPAPPAAQTQHANGLVQDWSTSHVIYPRVGNPNAMMALQRDVRAIQSWQLAARNALLRSRVPPRFLPIQTDAHRDWSISLAGGSVAPSMYPAKFSFNVNALPDCNNDFVVFAVNAATGSGTQPNIVGFQNLYSGTVPSTGICNRTPVVGTDSGVAATAYFLYNVAAGTGQISTSPTLSLDGQKVAFVETGSGGTAHFHVLAWAQLDGVLGDLQDVTNTPVQLTPTGVGFVTSAPVEFSGSATDLALTPSSGTASDTLSSPFVDYAFDVAYVGNDSGTLFRVKNVFCAVPASPPPNQVCDDGGTEAPSVDASWGSSEGLATGCSGKLTGPVEDGSTGNVFVGCSDGKLYGFTNAGVALTNSPVTVGDGSATGGIVDPPLIDASNKFVYAVAGSNGGSPINSEVVVQVQEVFDAITSKWTFGTPVTATLGAGGQENMHAPAVNDAYLSGGPTAAAALIYDWGLASGGAPITLYGVGFNGSGVMSTTPAHSLAVSGTSAVEFSPVTEIENSPNDLLFVSGLVSVTSPAFNFIEYNINSFPSADPPSGGAGSTGATFATAGPGTSGIIVDNVSSSAQASSIYYGDLGANNAVKLTQGDLQ